MNRQGRCTGPEKVVRSWNSVRTVKEPRAPPAGRGMSTGGKKGSDAASA